MKDFFLVSSVSVLAIVCSFPLWFTFVDPPARPWHHWVCRLSQVSSQACSVVSWRCRNSCGSDLRVKEFDAVAEVLHLLCPTTLVDGRVHRISVSVVLVYQYLSNQASSLRLLIVRSFSCRAEPESPQFRRVWSVDRTICPLRSAVCVAALHQFIFNVILERTICAQCRSPQAPLTCCFDQYVLQWMGEDTFDVPCFHPPQNRATCDSTYR